MSSKRISGHINGRSVQLNSVVNETESGSLTRALVNARRANGTYVPLNSDGQGHLEISIHGPLLPFGSVHVENLHPVFQIDGVYTINSLLVTSGASLGGSASSVNSAFVCDTTTSSYGNAVIQSRKRLRYRPGQGSILRFTAMFTLGGAAGTYQVAGMGHAEDGYYIGYKDTSFGIIYNQRGVRASVKVQITSAASSAGTVTITLNSVPLEVEVTNSANINRTAWEIAVAITALDAGWKAVQRSDYVYFINDSVGAKSGTYSLIDTDTTGTAGTFTTEQVGVAVTETFIPQASWNMDTLDGSNDINNPSGVELDIAKLNVYQIYVQYLGAGAVQFMVETSTAANNALWTYVHTIRHPNSLIATSLGNPSFAFTMAAYKLAASATALTVTCGSAMGAIEGNIYRHGPLVSYSATSASLGTAKKALMIIRNSYLFGGRTNQAVIILKSLTAAARNGNNILTNIQIVRNATITGNPNFAQYDANRSCALFADATGMEYSYTNNSQLIFSCVIGETGELIHTLASEQDEIDLQPGEYIVVGAYATSGTANYVHVGLNTREDI